MKSKFQTPYLKFCWKRAITLNNMNCLWRFLCYNSTVELVTTQTVWQVKPQRFTPWSLTEKVGQVVVSMTKFRVAQGPSLVPLLSLWTLPVGMASYTHCPMNCGSQSYNSNTEPSCVLQTSICTAYLNLY